MKKKILELIKKSTNGIECTSLNSIIRDQLHFPEESIQPLVNELIEAKDILILKEENILRYQSSSGQNNKWPNSFEQIGPPQCSTAIKSLKEILENYKDEITLILDLTSPTTFGNLEKRIHQNFKTIILFPPKKEFENERKDVYKQTLKEWIKFVKKFKGYNSLNLIISTKKNIAIRTSMLTREFARVNIRDINNTTTRNGIIIKVSNLSSIYHIFKDDIDTQIKTALPVFTVNPLSYILKIIVLPALPLVGFGIAVYFSTFFHPILTIISAIITGFIATYVYEKIKNY